MQRDNNRLLGTARLSASLFFAAPPGIGWRMHISKVAADIRATPQITRPFRSGKKV
jgi:hypothetical protein